MTKRASNKKSNRDKALRVFRELSDEIVSVLDELEDETDQFSGSKRASRRQSFRDLECHVDIYHTNGTAPTSCLVPTRDLSTTGIAFLHRSYLHTGSQVTVHLRDLQGVTRTNPATIMRCRYVKGMIHEIGARFAKPIDLGRYVELEPLRLAMLFDDDSAAQVGVHQLMCAGSEPELAESVEKLQELITSKEFDAIIFQGDCVTEETVSAIRKTGYIRPILAISSDSDTADLKDRADHVFVGPISPSLAGELVEHIRAA